MTTSQLYDLEARKTAVETELKTQLDPDTPSFDVELRTSNNENYDEIYTASIDDREYAVGLNTENHRVHGEDLVHFKTDILSRLD